VVQAGVADGILDAVIEGIIPKDQVNDLCIVALLWIDPGCIELEKAGTLDKADMYKNNYEAIKLALKRALNDEPSIDELIANRKKIKHCMWEESWGEI
jgi:formaldehyde-activating enzyme